MGSGELRTSRVKRWQVRKVRLTTQKPTVFHGDGEILGSTPVEIEAVPRALQVLAPAPPLMSLPVGGTGKLLPPGNCRALLNEIQHQAGVAPLKAGKISKIGRSNVVEYVMRILAICEIRRIGAQAKLVLFGTVRARDVECKFPVESYVKREVKGEALVVGHTDIVLQNVHV